MRVLKDQVIGAIKEANVNRLQQILHKNQEAGNVLTRTGYIQYIVLVTDTEDIPARLMFDFIEKYRQDHPELEITLSAAEKRIIGQWEANIAGNNWKELEESIFDHDDNANTCELFLTVLDQLVKHNDPTHSCHMLKDYIATLETEALHFLFPDPHVDIADI